MDELVSKDYVKDWLSPSLVSEDPAFSLLALSSNDVFVVSTVDGLIIGELFILHAP